MMAPNRIEKPSLETKIIRYTYIITMVIMTLTGFGQMPIFKRYYIADIPGFGWLARFYVTHYLHYLGAIVLFVLLAYILMSYFLNSRKNANLPFFKFIQGAILTGILVTGLLLVVRNLQGVVFSAGFIILLDISHLVLVMMLLAATLYGIVHRKSWTSTFQERMKKE